MARSAGNRYVVFGAGGVATAAACDLGLWGEAAEIMLADAELGRAKEAAARATRMLKAKKLKVAPLAVDLEKKADLAKALKGAQGVLSTLPPAFNLGLAQAAVQAKAHYADTGAPLAVARAIQKLAPAARKAGVSLLSDCGLSPGLSSSLAMLGMTTLDFSREVKVYAGAIPQRPIGPLDYATIYPVADLLELYLRPATILRRGRVEELEALTEREDLDFAGVGTLEACLTGGSSSSCPQSFQGRLVVFEEKTVRYPGHFEKVAAMRDMGFMNEEPVTINGSRVAPRELFLTLAARAWSQVEEKDLVVLRVLVRGKKHGRPTEAGYDLVDRFDPETGFSAVERTTAFPAAAALALQARGKVKPGAEPVELCLPHRDFIAEVKRRGLRIAEAIRASAV
ncbi:MAG: saccharopine dehydrogenase NADP-binding domain-containing protein [Elusimicrobia bacterium]|nr:saccharopine dehydrogenase NADP-binding domain-containing protein [Elusimicrobiota bacterium]